MIWPNSIKVGGTVWRLIIGVRDIVSHEASEYYAGECRENSKEIEVSRGEGDGTVDVFLHELVHAIQYHLGMFNEPDRQTDVGNEDMIAQTIKMLLADNPDLVRSLVAYLESQ